MHEIINFHAKENESFLRKLIVTSYISVMYILKINASVFCKIININMNIFNKKKYSSLIIIDAYKYIITTRYTVSEQHYVILISLRSADRISRSYTVECF